VYKAAAQLVAANPHLQARLKLLPSTGRILRRDGGGFYAVFPADGDLQDGIEPSLAIRDEVQRWKTLRAETRHGTAWWLESVARILQPRHAGGALKPGPFRRAGTIRQSVCKLERADKRHSVDQVLRRIAARMHIHHLVHS
jgi:hypothetical protein